MAKRFSYDISFYDSKGAEERIVMLGACEFWCLDLFFPRPREGRNLPEAAIHARNGSSVDSRLEFQLILGFHLGIRRPP